MHCVAVDKANNAGEVCFDVLGVSTGVGVSARPPAEKSHYAVLPVRRCYSQHWPHYVHLEKSLFINYIAGMQLR